MQQAATLGFDPKLAWESATRYSNNNRTLLYLGPNGQWNTYRSEFLLESGHHEIDVALLVSQANHIMLGLCKADFSYPPTMHGGLNCWQLYALNGHFYDGPAARGYSAAFGVGALVTLLVNLDGASSNISYVVNGQNFPVAAAGAFLAGPLRFFVAFHNANDSVEIRRWLNGNKPPPLARPSKLPDLLDGTAWTKMRAYIRSVALPLRIGVLAPSGAGKSSLLRTILSAFKEDDDDYISSAVKIGGQASTQLTTEVNVFPIPGTQISGVDTWYQHSQHEIGTMSCTPDSALSRVGHTQRMHSICFHLLAMHVHCTSLCVLFRGWNDANYSDGELVGISDGRLNHGFKMNTAAMEGTPGYIAHPSRKQRVHAWIVMLSVDDALNTNKPPYNKLKEFVAKLLAHNYRPILLLSKVDKLDSRLAQRPETAFDSVDVQLEMTAASQQSGIQLDSVFPCKLYHNELLGRRRKETEVIPLAALMTAVKAAEDNYRRMAAAAGEAEEKQ
jgi:hypothetical protein